VILVLGTLRWVCKALGPPQKKKISKVVNPKSATKKRVDPERFPLSDAPIPTGARKEIWPISGIKKRKTLLALGKEQGPYVFQRGRSFRTAPQKKKPVRKERH